MIQYDNCIHLSLYALLEWMLADFIFAFIENQTNSVDTLLVPKFYSYDLEQGSLCNISW